MNLVGSFAAGFIAIWLEGRGPSALYWRAFMIVGVLGALTTYVMDAPAGRSAVG